VLDNKYYVAYEAVHAALIASSQCRSSDALPTAAAFTSLLSTGNAEASDHQEGSATCHEQPASAAYRTQRNATTEHRHAAADQSGCFFVLA
jgi:hypothetical protein